MHFATRKPGRTRRGWLALPAIVLAAIVVACGGGHGMGSGLTAPATPAGVSVGAITGFGSVHLNGKKFQTSTAKITIDGQSATQDDLHVGDVIEVKGHHDAATNQDIADEIEMHSNVQGPVSSIDTAAQSLRVLGQTVVVTTDTSFDDDIHPASLAGIAIGDILEVSGMPAANGDIHATRIERKPAGSAFRVMGTAASTDATAGTLQINALTVNYSAATLADFPASGPADGDLVEATGTSLGAAGELLASRLELRTGRQLEAEAEGETELEGLVTRFASATDFDVSGRAVTTSPDTDFEGGAATDLAANVRVEVEGTVNGDGVLVAAKVRIERAADVQIVAQADAVDASSGSVTVLGIRVNVTAMTRFEDHSTQNVRTFGVADIHVGDWLEVRGSAPATGSAGVAATRLERRDSEAGVVLGGVVEAAEEPLLTVLSVHVATTAATQLRDASGAAIASSVFFTGLVGQTVKVIGSWDGTTLAASSASLGENEGD